MVTEKTDESGPEAESLQTDMEPEPEPEPELRHPAACCWLCLIDGPALLRGCACRGSAGFVHVSCLVTAATHDPATWVRCPTCKQDFYGELRRGLATARWELAAALAEGSTERLAAQAAMLESQGRFLEAVPLFEEVLARDRAKLGDEHSETLTSIYTLAVLHSMNGDKEEALCLAEEALAGRRRRLGDDDVSTLSSMSLVGILHIDLEQYEAALPLCLDVLRGRRRVLGEEHISTQDSVNDLAVLYNDMGKPEEAVPLYQQAVLHCRRLLGDTHPNTLRAIQNLGEATCATGRAGLQVSMI
jgi:tetratricopeptide (TPR) repeat protein